MSCAVFSICRANGEARQETAGDDKAFAVVEMGVTEQIGQGNGHRLDSWKAIAQFLGRDVRSAQRWEHERGLPVHRLPGDKASSVFAYESELNQWLLSREQETTFLAEADLEIPEFRSRSSAQIESAGRPSPRHVPRSAVVWMAAVAVGIVVVALAILRWQPGEVAAPLSFSPRSIAVLPMLNLSGDRAQDYFADGFTDELVTELAQIRALRVISRTSTMVYKGSRKPLPEIARELHVKYVLEGSVVRDGQRIRVIAQLIDALSDTHVSAHTYNADVQDVLDVQNQISRAIADDVRLDLSSGEKVRLASVRAVDPVAHDLYLKATYAFAEQTPQSIRQSLALYEAAAGKAPSFARAYVGIARAEAALLQITAESPEESIKHEKMALAKALSIDPHLGDARGLLAALVYWHDQDWPRAEREFRLALADGAQTPTEQRFGSALITRGRFEEGMAHLQKALELDPFDKSPRVNKLIGLEYQRRYAEARREVETVLASSPDFLAGHDILGMVAIDQNDCKEADLQARWIKTHFPSPMADILSAAVSACTGDFATARQLLARAEVAKGSTFISPYQLGLGYASIHDRQATLTYLEKSAELREPQIMGLKVEPGLDWIRSDPRFIALEKRLGLAD
jgi:TolB-like protein/Tfp pilus assembly protein PilF